MTRRISTTALLALLMACVMGSTYNPGTYSPGTYVKDQGTYVGGDDVGNIVLLTTGLGGGGRVYGLAASPDGNVVLAGSDVSGAYISRNGGKTFDPQVRGSQNLNIDSYQYYVTGGVGLDEPEFSGIIYTSRGGIYSIRNGSVSATLMTPADSYWYDNPLDLDWRYILPFSCIANDGDLLVAGAGTQRIGYENGHEEVVYPYQAAVDTSSHGIYSVWICRDLSSDGTGTWEPFYALGDIGPCRDVDVVFLGGSGDTLISAATRRGVYIYDSSTEDIDSTITQTRNVINQGNDYSFVINGDTRHQPYSVQMTSRRTVYVGIEVDDNVESPKAGCYRLHDFRSAGDSLWWVGDDTPVERPAKTNGDSSLWELSYGDGTGDNDLANNRISLCQIRVLEGSGSDPDTVFGADRQSFYGLGRALVPYAAGAGGGVSWREVYWQQPGADMTGLYWRPRIGGWLRVNPAHFGKPAVQPGGIVVTAAGDRLLVSSDYGEHWTNRYAYPHPSEDDYWQTSGYDELNVPAGGVGVLPDGKAVAGFTDVGMAISLGSDWQWWKDISPPTESVSNQTVGSVWNTEVGGLAVVDDWYGTGRPAVVSSFGDIVSEGEPSRVLVYHDDNDDGSMTWYAELTNSLANADRYLFYRPVAAGGVVYCGYELYDGEVGGGGSRTDQGVMRFTTSDGGATWTPADWSTNIQDSDSTECHPGDLVYSPAHDELYFGLTGNHGGIYARGTGDGGWRKIMGPGTALNVRDVWSLDTTPYGAHLYVGLRGGSGYANGGVYKTENPNAGAPTWTRLTNSDTDDISPVIPTSDLFDARGWTTQLTIARRLADVIAVHVDEQDSTRVWLGYDGGDRSYQAGWAGLYLMTNDGVPVEKSQDKKTDSIAIRAFAQHGDDMLVGTRGYGLATYRVGGGAKAITNAVSLDRVEPSGSFAITGTDTTGGTVVVNVAASPSESATIQLEWSSDGITYQDSTAQQATTSPSIDTGLTPAEADTTTIWVRGSFLDDVNIYGPWQTDSLAPSSTASASAAPVAYGEKPQATGSVRNPVPVRIAVTGYFRSSHSYLHNTDLDSLQGWGEAGTAAKTHTFSLDFPDSAYQGDTLIVYVHQDSLGNARQVASDTTVCDFPLPSLTISNDGHITGTYVQGGLDQFTENLSEQDASQQYDVVVTAWDLFDDAVAGYDWISAKRTHNPDLLVGGYFYTFAYSHSWSGGTPLEQDMHGRMSHTEYRLRDTAGDTVMSCWGDTTGSCSSGTEVPLMNITGFRIVGSDTIWAWQEIADGVSEWFNHSYQRLGGTFIFLDWGNTYEYPSTELAYYGGQHGGLSGYQSVNYMDMDQDGTGHRDDSNWYASGKSEREMWRECNTNLVGRIRAKTGVPVILNGFGDEEQFELGTSIEYADLRGYVHGGMAEHQARWGETIAGGIRGIGAIWNIYLGFDDLADAGWPVVPFFWTSHTDSATSYRDLPLGLLTNSISFFNDNDPHRSASGIPTPDFDIGTSAGEPTLFAPLALRRMYTDGQLDFYWHTDWNGPTYTNRWSWAVLDGVGDTLSQYNLANRPNLAGSPKTWVFGKYAPSQDWNEYDPATYDVAVLASFFDATLQAPNPTTLRSHRTHTGMNITSTASPPSLTGSADAVIAHYGLENLKGSTVDLCLLQWKFQVSSTATTSDTLYIVGLDAAGWDWKDWAWGAGPTFSKADPTAEHDVDWPVDLGAMTWADLGSAIVTYVPSGSFTAGNYYEIDITEIAQAAADADNWGGVMFIKKGPSGTWVPSSYYDHNDHTYVETWTIGGDPPEINYFALAYNDTNASGKVIAQHTDTLSESASVRRLVAALGSALPDSAGLPWLAAATDHQETLLTDIDYPTYLADSTLYVIAEGTPESADSVRYQYRHHDESVSEWKYLGAVASPDGTDTLSLTEFPNGDRIRSVIFTRAAYVRNDTLFNWFTADRYDHQAVAIRGLIHAKDADDNIVPSEPDTFLVVAQEAGDTDPPGLVSFVLDSWTHVGGNGNVWGNYTVTADENAEMWVQASINSGVTWIPASPTYQGDDPLDTDYSFSIDMGVDSATLDGTSVQKRCRLRDAASNESGIINGSNDAYSAPAGGGGWTGFTLFAEAGHADAHTRIDTTTADHRVRTGMASTSIDLSDSTSQTVNWGYSTDGNYPYSYECNDGPLMLATSDITDCGGFVNRLPLFYLGESDSLASTTVDSAFINIWWDIHRPNDADSVVVACMLSDAWDDWVAAADNNADQSSNSTYQYADVNGTTTWSTHLSQFDGGGNEALVAFDPSGWGLNGWVRLDITWAVQQQITDGVPFVFGLTGKGASDGDGSIDPHFYDPPHGPYLEVYTSE